MTIKTRSDVAEVTQVASAKIPPLENGDHLTRHEFERRYSAMPHVKKAELIEGVVYMPSPVRAMSHAIPHSNVMIWLGLYRASTPHTILADNATSYLDLDNEVQPDAMLFIDEAHGGSARITVDDYVKGVPELIVEIAASSASYDLHEKFRVYRRSGVREYIVWQIETSRIDWWELKEGDYVPLSTNEHSVIASRAFPGLCLDVAAILADHMQQVLATLQACINSDEHAAFVNRLKQHAN